MELLVKRRLAIDDALPGEFYVDGKLTCFTLERASLAIPARRYEVRLTISARAVSGELWSPRDHLLPLVEDVPGRSGIRIHAANFYYEVVGCIALGLRLSGDQLVQSRVAVELFVDRLAVAEAKGEETFLTVQNPIGAGQEMKFA